MPKPIYPRYYKHIKSHLQQLDYFITNYWSIVKSSFTKCLEYQIFYYWKKIEEWKSI